MTSQFTWRPLNYYGLFFKVKSMSHNIKYNTTWCSLNAIYICMALYGQIRATKVIMTK